MNHDLKVLPYPPIGYGAPEPEPAWADYRVLFARLQRDLRQAELSESSLSSCMYVGISCSHCGEVRQALAEFPSEDQLLCPLCGATCRVRPLAVGLTSKALPFHELYRPAPRGNENRIPWDRLEVSSLGAPAKSDVQEEQLSTQRPTNRLGARSQTM